MARTKRTPRRFVRPPSYADLPNGVRHAITERLSVDDAAALAVAAPRDQVAREAVREHPDLGLWRLVYVALHATKVFIVTNDNQRPGPALQDEALLYGYNYQTYTRGQNTVVYVIRSDMYQARLVLEPISYQVIFQTRRETPPRRVTVFFNEAFLPVGEGQIFGGYEPIRRAVQAIARRLRLKITPP